jgi:hypothetical protein
MVVYDFVRCRESERADGFRGLTHTSGERPCHCPALRCAKPVCVVEDEALRLAEPRNGRRLSLLSEVCLGSPETNRLAPTR